MNVAEYIVKYDEHKGNVTRVVNGRRSASDILYVIEQSGVFNGDEKAPLNELREKIDHYRKAHYEIMNLSNDVVDFPLFRVMA